MSDMQERAAKVAGKLPERPATFTFEHDSGCYYFKPSLRTPPPYRKQLTVEAIVDVASDGTLAGVEIGHWESVPAPLPLQSVALPTDPTRSALEECVRAMEVVLAKLKSEFGSVTILDQELLDRAYDKARNALEAK